MATSGEVKTNITYESYFWVKWEQSGNQDAANNRTLIKWSCGVYCGHSFYSNAIEMSAFKINETQVYGGGTYSNYAKGNHTIASGTLYIPHDTDGQKTFAISSFTGWLWENHNYSASATAHSLTAIPRKATITEASDFKDTENPSIKVSNPGGFKMDVWLEPNPVGDHLCVRTGITLTAEGRYTWTLTDAEREALRNKCSGKGNCTIRLGLYTYIDNTTYSDYKDKKFTMTENNATKPSVTVSVKLNNGSLPSQFDGMYIQGKSKVDVTLKTSAKYGATIKSYSSKVDGKMYYNLLSFTSNVIQNPGNVVIDGYATDSREFYGTDRKTINVLEYAKPSVIPIGSENAIQCYRSDGNGKRTGSSTSLWIKAARSWHTLNDKNKCALQWRWKKAGADWNATHSWNDLIAKSASGNEYDDLVSGTFDLKEAYTVQIKAVDDIGEENIKTFDVPTEDVALHLGKGGKNVSIGSYCDYSEEYIFHSEWKAIFDNDIIVKGQTLKDYIKSVINGGG